MLDGSNQIFRLLCLFVTRFNLLKFSKSLHSLVVTYYFKGIYSKIRLSTLCNVFFLSLDN